MYFESWETHDFEFEWQTLWIKSHKLLLRPWCNKNLEYLRLSQPAWPLMIGHSHLWPISVICGPFQIQLHVSVAMYLSYNDQIGSKGSHPLPSDQPSINQSWSSTITPLLPRWPLFAWPINHTPATRSAEPLENNFLTSISGAGISSTLSPRGPCKTPLNTNNTEPWCKSWLKIKILWWSFSEQNQALQENLLQLPPVDMQVDPILLPLLLPS
jgi:hypothetical protein